MRSRGTHPPHDEIVHRRLAQLSAELAEVRGDEVDLSSQPAVVPVPGRHASRRRAVLQTLVGRTAVAPAHVAVLAVVVALGLGATCWWVVRSDAAEVAAPPLISAPPLEDDVAGEPAGGAAEGPPEATAAAAQEPEVTVDVAGKVRRPGIAVLPAGSRVVDALEAAGGARRGVDLVSLNLARVLVDGEQILVGTPVPVGAAAAATPPAGSPGGPLVNLNTATQAELESLPDVGPVTALAILAWRTEHGGFTAIDELLEVDGIGEATLDTLAPYVTV